MKNKFGWLALATLLAYEVVQIVPPMFNHAMSLVASAVWGS
jgi:hypothetical protein